MSAPRLTVKSIAEMLWRPQSDISRKVRQYKYPKQQPQASHIPFYQSVAAAVRQYYRESNKSSVLLAARNRALSIPNESRRINAVRVLDNFRDSPHASRRLEVGRNRRYSATIGKIELKLSADMQATEKGELRVVYFGYKALGVDAEIAVLLAELAHWVLEQNKVDVRMDQVEVMDFSTGKRYRTQTRRGSTLRALTAKSTQVASMWDSV